MATNHLYNQQAINVSQTSNGVLLQTLSLAKVIICMLFIVVILTFRMLKLSAKEIITALRLI